MCCSLCASLLPWQTNTHCSWHTPAQYGWSTPSRPVSVSYCRGDCARRQSVSVTFSLSIFRIRTRFFSWRPGAFPCYWYSSWQQCTSLTPLVLIACKFCDTVSNLVGRQPNPKAAFLLILSQELNIDDSAYKPALCRMPSPTSATLCSVNKRDTL